MLTSDASKTNAYFIEHTIPPIQIRSTRIFPITLFINDFAFHVTVSQDVYVSLHSER
jgi:hypothetical protein